MKQKDIMLKTNLEVDSIVTEVINKFKTRAQKGKTKYGTDLDRTDLDLEAYLEHALEEHMDAILYLTKALKLERERKAEKDWLDN